MKKLEAGREDIDYYKKLVLDHPDWDKKETMFCYVSCKLDEGILALEEMGVSQLELPEIEYFLGSKVVNHMIKRNEYSYRLWNEVEEMPDEEREILALKYNRQAYLVDKLEHRLKRFMKYCKVQHYRHPREMTYKEWLQNREVDWEKL